MACIFGILSVTIQETDMIFDQESNYSMNYLINWERYEHDYVISIW